MLALVNIIRSEVADIAHIFPGRCFCRLLFGHFAFMLFNDTVDETDDFDSRSDNCENSGQGRHLSGEFGTFFERNQQSMTTHQLARMLLEMEEMPAMTLCERRISGAFGHSACYSLSTGAFYDR